MAARTDNTTIEVAPIARKSMELAVLGTTPLILNRMANKGLKELLYPKGRKTAAEKAQNLKHEPEDEFRNAALMLKDGSSLLGILSTAFKAAMMDAALEVPGAKKAQIGRLVYVEGESVPVHGHPYLFMAVTRSADMNKTPDVRTRPILPRWACMLRVTYVVPTLNERSMLNLLAAAGIVCGVGDWRQQKGKGHYGQFTLVSPDDPEWLDVMSEGRAVQEVAMSKPVPYDDQSAELLEWFKEERERRGQ